MTSVLNHQADIVFVGKLDCLGNVGSMADSNGIANVVSKLARGRTVAEGIAASVGEVC